VSLRWRITVLTVVLIAGASALLGFAAYATATRIQVEAIDAGLVSALTAPRIRVLESRLRVEPADTYVTVAIGRVDGSTVTPLRLAGTATEPVPFPALTADELAAASDGPITIDGSPDYRVLVRQPKANRSPFVAATPLETAARAQSRLAGGILLSAAIVAVLGGVVSWVIVRRFFRPMVEMVDAAQSIAAGDTSRRVPDAPRGTELGELSAALNSMIGSLTASLENVEASEDRLRRFVSDASHEIRTPLTVIIGYVELLRRDATATDDLDSRALARIDAESRRLERLVSSMLLLERLDVESTATDATFDLGALVEEYARDLTAIGPPRPVHIDVASAQVAGDPDEWRQLLANLMQNITRYTPDGSPVDITVVSSAPGIVLTVDDAGPGIAPDQRTLAVERFHRLEHSQTSATGGFGLGLSIVTSVVARSGGRLDLLDSPLGGLRVRISIPEARATEPVGNLPAGP
jgi:two-component system, OmpR family, sensor kinase